jgi:hypothetical protein
MSNHDAISPPGLLTIALDVVWSAATGTSAALVLGSLVTLSASLFVAALATASVGIAVSVVESLRARRYSSKVGLR